MRKGIIMAVVPALLAAAALFSAGCDQGDTGSPEGYFKGCHAQVSKIQSALESAIRTRGSLEGINSVNDVYTYMSGGSQEKYDELLENQKLYCIEVWVQAGSADNYYRVEAFAVSAPKCMIVAEPDKLPEPRELYECIDK